MKPTIESIIEKAIAGEYSGVSHRNQKGRWTGVRVLSKDDISWVVLDPLFWQALGKECGWWDRSDAWAAYHQYNCEGKEWLWNASHFHHINLTEGWDKAVAWLEELVK